jgi:hypothetical protein
VSVGADRTLEITLDGPTRDITCTGPCALPGWRRSQPLTSRPYSKSPTSPPGSQTALAKLAGVTQARVSTIVRDLARAGLVSTERGQPWSLTATVWCTSG